MRLHEIPDDFQGLIKFRFSHDQSFVAYMDKIFNVTISPNSSLDGFDKAMWSFSENPVE